MGEWQAKQDAAKAAKEARWGANAGAETRARIQVQKQQRYWTYRTDQWNHRVARRRLAGKYNKDGTLNKEWQAKQDAAKAAKEARWGANAGAETRARIQVQKQQRDNLRNQGLLSRTNHRVARRRLGVSRRTKCPECNGNGHKTDVPAAKCWRCNGTGEVTIHRRLIRLWSQCRACDGSGYTKEWSQRFKFYVNTECKSCNGIGEVQNHRRLAVDTKEWTECTECDGRGYIKEWTRGYMSNRECTKCNGDGGSMETPVPAEVQEAMQRFYRENGRKMPTRELSEACRISTQRAFNYLKKFKPINA